MEFASAKDFNRKSGVAQRTCPGLPWRDLQCAYTPSKGPTSELANPAQTGLFIRTATEGSAVSPNSATDVYVLQLRMQFGVVDLRYPIRLTKFNPYHSNPAMTTSFRLPSSHTLISGGSWEGPKVLQQINFGSQEGRRCLPLREFDFEAGILCENHLMSAGNPGIENNLTNFVVGKPADQTAIRRSRSDDPG
jgi:hypothetical protein